MKELILQVAGGKLISSKELKSTISSLRDGKHLFRISTYTRRSLRQNAYYHGVVVPMVRQGLFDAGYSEVREPEDAHAILKHIFLKRVIKSDDTGEEIVIAGSTSTLPTTEFNEFIDNVIRWAAEYLGIIIPDPNQEAVAMLEEFNSRK